MAQFGVGRNALREAIKILEAFGLVTVRRGAGTYVQDSCTFDLLVPLFPPAALALPPQRRTFRGPSKGLDHARALDPPTQGEESIFGQIVPLVHFLFRGCSPAVSQSPSPRQGKSKRPPVRSSGRSSRTWPTGNSVPGTNSPLSRT